MKKIENVRYYRDPAIKGLEVCRVYRSGHVFPNHSHDGIYAIGLMEEGGCYCFESGRDDSLVRPGQIALINPGQVHSGIPVEDGRVTYRMIYLDFDLMSDLASDFAEKPGAMPEFRSSVIYDPAHYAFLQNLWQRMAGNRGRLEKESTLLEGLALLVSEYGGIGKPIARTAGGNRLVGQARELLSENLEDKITLEEAARSVGLSRYHFLRVFKNETGLSPHAFRTQKRIEAGKRLLRQGLPFVQVALMTGFNDQSHFTNKFRQYVGASPSQYLD